MKVVKLPPFEEDLAKAKTLPAELYREPDVLALEKERVFSRTWQPVGRASDVAKAGDYITADVAGEPVVVVRGNDGVLRGFFNVCRHRAGAPASGSGNRQTLQCSYHGWTYDLLGKLIGAPEFDRVDDVSLLSLRADVWGPFVFVCLDQSTPPLSEWLGEMIGETGAHDFTAMKLARKKDWVIGCNWKIYVDNYLEGYHIPVAHPRLYKELDYAKYRVDTRRYHSFQHAPTKGGMYGADDKALYYWVFPNWMVNIYPDNMSINIIVPLGVDKTLTIFEWYFHEEKMGDVDKVVAFSDEIQLEDIAICEAVQKRIFSRAYREGRFLAKRENGVHHFQGLLHEFLSG